MTKGIIKSFRILCAVLAAIILVSVILAYSHYLRLKKVFISEISRKASSLIGQQVRIKDIALNPAAVIVIDDLEVENPPGFGEGQLLKIRRLSLSVRYRELFRERLSFRSIDIDQPDLQIRKDKNNRLNISDALRSFLSRKTTTRYSIDTTRIRSGVLGVNAGQQYRLADIDLTLDHLSSDPGTKTLFKLTASAFEKGVLSAEGSVLLKDDPVKFDLSVSLKYIDLSFLSGFIKGNKIPTAVGKAEAVLRATGDMANGADLRSEVSVRSEGTLFGIMGRKEVKLTSDAFLNIRAGSLLIRDAMLNAGDTSSVQITGTVKDLISQPSYSAEALINVRDLSAFNIMKGITVGGVMTSNTIHITGKLDGTMPKISGVLQFSHASFKAAKADLEDINAKITFSSEKEMSAQGGVVARVMRAGHYVFSVPSDAKFNFNVRGKATSLALVSSAEFIPLQVSIEKEKALRVERVKAGVEGVMGRGTFVGKGSFGLTGIRLGDYTLKNCDGALGLDYQGNNIILKKPDIRSDAFKISADEIRMAILSRNKTLTATTRNLSGSYPEKKMEINQLNCSADLNFAENDLSGRIAFADAQIDYQRLSKGIISGKAKFNKDTFSLDFAGTNLFGGTANFSVGGRTSGGPFPMTLTAAIGKIDLREMSSVLARSYKIPYQPTGELDVASFRGTLESGNLINGTASFRGKKLSVFKSGEDKPVIKDGVLNSEATFHGRDLEFKAEASSGALTASLSGRVDGFMEKNRSGRVHLALPEVKAPELRNAFWNVFPDSLLYAGLEGSVAADISVDSEKGRLSVEGGLKIKDLRIEGENGEYAIGPVNGNVPVHYSTAAPAGEPPEIPSFDRTEFDSLNAYYAKKHAEEGFSRITIGSLRYGFNLVEDIEIEISQKGRYLNVRRIGANIFGGRLSGSAFISFSDGLHYRVGMIVKGISLTRLCDDIPPIKGYISGRVDGIALLKGSGQGKKDLIGRADFWSYSAGGEKTVMSREFLQKIGGPSMQAYLGERPFDKGVIGVYLEKGFLIFRELEISHKNFFGMTDLSVKVAPLNNRIELDHLMSTIAEAAERAKGK